MAASAITVAMICRCFDSRSMRQASFHATPFSSPAEAMSLSATSFDRLSITVTMTVQPATSTALTSSRLLNPTHSTVCCTRKEAINPPSEAPAPMKPKKRFPSRGL